MRGAGGRLRRQGREETSAPRSPPATARPPFPAWCCRFPRLLFPAPGPPLASTAVPAREVRPGGCNAARQPLPAARPSAAAPPATRKQQRARAPAWPRTPPVEPGGTGTPEGEVGTGARYPGQAPCSCWEGEARRVGLGHWELDLVAAPVRQAGATSLPCSLAALSGLKVMGR